MKTNKNLPQIGEQARASSGQGADYTISSEAEADGDTILTVLTPHSGGDSFKWQHGGVCV